MPATESQRLPSRRALGVEVLVVLALSLGQSAVYAVLSLVNSFLQTAPLRGQSAVINGSVVPEHQWLDLAYQLADVAFALAPVALVVFLLVRTGESPASVGLDGRRTWRELAWGAGLAVVIGGAGLALYLGAYHAGFNVKVIPTTLPAVWWRIPVLLLDAAQNGVLEEVVVCGYLLHRLDQLGWGRNGALVTSAVIRGSYHLYQGFGGFAGNAVMGLIFGRLYQRTGRLGRLVVAHTLIDAGAFVGYVLLVNRVSWIP